MPETTSNSKATTGPDERLKFSQFAAYGAGGIIPIALFNVAGILVGLMGNISLGLSAFWLGAILIVPRLWDALSDPLIGHLSDNTRTRWGRRRPYLLLGGIAVAVTFVLIWWIPKGDLIRAWFPTEAGFQWFQLSYILFSLLIFFTAVNIFEIPHGALGMELTTDYHERTRLFSAKSFVGNLFAMSTPWLFALASMEVFKGVGGNEADGMRYVSLMIAAILIPLSFWWFFMLREPAFKKVAKQEKTPFWKDMRHTATNRNFIMLTLTIFTLAMGFNFVNLLGSYIPIFYIFGGDKVAGAYLLGINGTIWAVTGLLAVFPLNWISPKLGKRNTLIISILLMCLAQLSKIVCYNPDYPYLIIIPTVLLSAGMLFFFTLGSSMVGDICDEDELKTGHRSEGSYYSVFWWFIKMGTALASFVAGALIVFTLFDETQVTKVDKIQGSVREFQTEVKELMALQSASKMESIWIEKVKTKTTGATKETKEFIVYLERERKKKPENLDKTGLEFYHTRNQTMAVLLKSAQINLNNLQELRKRLTSLGIHPDSLAVTETIQGSIPILLQIKSEKSRMHASELLAHLELKSKETKKSKEHYDLILREVKGVNEHLTTMQTDIPLRQLDASLGAIEAEMVPLTQQSPYTLLMMRVVEIGLPLLLSLFSLIFIFRYSLTEKRSHEIKELLKQQNTELNKVNS